MGPQITSIHPPVPISFSALSPNILYFSPVGKAKKAIHVNRYWAMIEQFKNELEQRLQNLQRTVQSASLQDISKELEDLYERALVAELVDARNRQKAEVFARVAKSVSEAPATTHVAAPEPKHQPLVQATNPYPMNPEIKVLGIPDGPPMPVIDHVSHDEPEEIDPEPEVKTPPPPAPKVVATPAKPQPVVQIIAVPESKKPTTTIAEKAQQGKQQTSLHQRLASGNLAFGLNDRIAYIKHLFEGSAEDFNRVVNQLNTFENWEEAERFIAEMVKPDYNWQGKEAYEVRFVAQVKTRFEA